MGIQVINLLAALLVVTSLLVVLSKSPKSAAKCYALQSAVLVAIFIALGVVVGSTELFVWSGTALVTKVILVPAILLYAYKKMGEPQATYKPRVTPVMTIVIAVVEVLVCFAVIQGVNLPAAAEVHPALAISLAHFFIGLTCIITQRNIFKQMLGYCLMENGSHLTLALLAPAAPEIVEIGIATDAIFAVIIMALIAVKVFNVKKSLDAQDLMELKG